MATTSPFEWVPGRGPDGEALKRLQAHFRRPVQPMGEAWFMGNERKIYVHLLEMDAETMHFDFAMQALEEIAGGTINLLWSKEWDDWFHYLLGRLIHRSHEYGTMEYLVEPIVTAFISLYPNGLDDERYRGFRSDVLRTLAVCNMDARLWENGRVRENAMLWRFHGRPQDCRGVCGDFSCLMFFCMKYLEPDLISPWLQSVFAINCPRWRAQLMIWLTAAQPLLSGKAKQPAEFEGRLFAGLDPGWSWSHLIRGGYFLSATKQHTEVEFIPQANLVAFNDALRSVITESLFYDWLDCFSNDATLKDNLYELPERFLSLYLAKDA